MRHGAKTESRQMAHGPTQGTAPVDRQIQQVQLVDPGVSPADLYGVGWGLLMLGCPCAP